MHTDEAIAGTQGRPSSKNRVHGDAGIWDEGGKREERFVLVDMAESFINTWLTRTLLGLAP